MISYRQNIDATINQEASGSLAKTFMSSVFSWMFAALGITAVIAWQFASSPALLSLLANETGMTGFGYFVMFSPLGFVLLMSYGYHRLSIGVLALLLIVFSVLMGMSMSFIFIIYTLGSVFSIFMITALMFGLMAIAGYTTKTDLTKFGSLMIMGLIGIIIASVLNIFIGSNGLDYIISFIGVIVFTGLTAYHIQKLKRIGMGLEYGSNSAKKMAILGAFTLYLDFINLFLFMLRLFGGRK